MEVRGTTFEAELARWPKQLFCTPAMFFVGAWSFVPWPLPALWSRHPFPLFRFQFKSSKRHQLYQDDIWFFKSIYIELSLTLQEVYVGRKATHPTLGKLIFISLCSCFKTRYVHHKDFQRSHISFKLIFNSLCSSPVRRINLRFKTGYAHHRGFHRSPL